MENNQKDKTIISRIRQLLEKADSMEQGFRERVFKNAVSEYMEIKNNLKGGLDIPENSSPNNSSQAEKS